MLDILTLLMELYLFAAKSPISKFRGAESSKVKKVFCTLKKPYY